MSSRFLLPALLGLALVPAGNATADVVINEIFYHAPDDLNDLEWVELHNPDDKPADVSGWRFTSGITFQFPEKSLLPPGGFLVLSKDRRLFTDYYDAPVDGEFKGSLRNSGETLVLADAGGRTVDRTTYADKAPWPAAADGISASLERITPATSGERVDNWSSSPLPEDMDRPAGTPGKPNASYSAHFPPTIAKLTITPRNPAPGQSLRVEARVESPGGAATVELRYRIAKPGSVGDEKSIPMTASDGVTYRAELPGQDGSQLLRLRIRAVDPKNAERFLPSANSLRPAVSLFVQSAPEAASIPLASLLNSDPREFASMERLRRRSLQPSAGPFGDPGRNQLQQILDAGLNLPSAWFEWTLNQPVDHATYRKLRTVFLAMDAERSGIVEEAMAAEDAAAQLRALPARIQAFQAALGERVKSALPAADAATFEAWHQKHIENQRGPEGFFRRLMDLEGAWFGVNTATEFTAQQIDQLRPTLKTAIEGRAGTAAKLMRRELDFGKAQLELGAIAKTLEQELRPILTTRQRRGLEEWRSGQGSPIRPRLGVARPPPPRGQTAFIVSDPKTGETEVFDFLHVTERSAGYRVRFHKDHPWNGMTSAALLFEYNDRFLLAEPLAFELYRRAGNAACKTDFVRLSMNGHTLGYHLVVEQMNNAFLRRNRLDPDGDLYKILWYGSGIEGQHEKQNNPDRDHSALQQLITSLDSTKGDAQWDVIQKNFNVPQVINYFAVNSVLSHWDGFFNNYFTYRAPNPDGRWEMFPWDQDKTWGFHDTSGDQVFFDMPLSFGMEGDRPPGGGEPQFRPDHWWRPGGFFSKPLLANPEFRKRYLQRIRQVVDDIYTEKDFFPVIDALADRLRPEIGIRAKVIGEDPSEATARLDRNVASLKEHLVKRRKFLLEQEELIKLPR